jgi:hypothetical protein
MSPGLSRATARLTASRCPAASRRHRPLTGRALPGPASAAVSLEPADLARAVAGTIVISSPCWSMTCTVVSPSSTVTVWPAWLMPAWMHCRATWMPPPGALWILTALIAASGLLYLLTPHAAPARPPATKSAKSIGPRELKLTITGRGSCRGYRAITVAGGRYRRSRSAPSCPRWRWPARFRPARSPLRPPSSCGR